MSVTAAALRELHRIHQRLADLRDRLERGPKQVRAREANLAQLEAKLAEARDRAKQTQVALDRKQLDLRSGEQKVVDLKVKLNGANSNREYQAFLEQIAAAEMAGSVLSDEILEGLEKIDQLHAATKEAEKNLAAGKQELDKARQNVESSAATIRTDVAQLETELIQAEKALPVDLKADYDRVVRSKGADSLAAADDGVCTGCGQQITLNMQNELKLSKLVFCKSCGRLLYLQEENAQVVSLSKVVPNEPSKHIDRVTELRAYVQSGEPKKVQQILQRFERDLVVWNLGYLVRMGNWEIDGFQPNSQDVEEGTGETDRHPAHVRIGEAIISGYSHGVIRFPKPWPWDKKSDFLKPVKDGCCGGCGQEVTLEMQHCLKASKEVRCKGCNVRLFGPGV